MHQRRPHGTDGSDFSYRMVVDSRYTKVAEGKAKLKTLITTQVLVQIIGAIFTFLLPPKQEIFVKIAIISSVSGFISLMVGEIGRSRSKATLLRLYTVGSSVATSLSAVCIAANNTLVEVIQDPSGWTSKKFELIDAARVLFSVLLQVNVVTTTLALVKNMSPPKRAS